MSINSIQNRRQSIQQINRTQSAELDNASNRLNSVRKNVDVLENEFKAVDKIVKNGFLVGCHCNCHSHCHSHRETIMIEGCKSCNCNHKTSCNECTALKALNERLKLKIDGLGIRCTEQGDRFREKDQELNMKTHECESMINELRSNQLTMNNLNEEIKRLSRELNTQQTKYEKKLEKTEFYLILSVSIAVLILVLSVLLIPK